MCGIVGVWGGFGGRDPHELVGAMADTLLHRGPDDSGRWVDADAALALGHRRLAVVDLSSAGHQPMVSPCGRYVLVYNGELYDHAELRDRLVRDGDGAPFAGHSDTETLLRALVRFGVRRTMELANGMFAFALWDRAERRLTLARDRLGEKPVYYGRVGRAFVFASELRALAAHPAWTSALDRHAVVEYLSWGRVPAPGCVFAGIRKLAPAHFVSVSDPGAEDARPERYWDLDALVDRDPRASDADPGAAVDELEELLRGAVGRRMLADVPLGAFVSGGIDSSTVVALMQAQSARPVRTFAIGFREDAFDEAAHARAVARHLGTEHTELRVTAQDALAVVPELPAVWDEPFGDSSQIPTLLVSRLARKHVTVVLSGDGGDELFHGYTRYARAARIWYGSRRLRPSLRRMAASILGSDALRSLLGFAGPLLPGPLGRAHVADRAPKLARLLDHDDPARFYREFVAHQKDAEHWVHGAGDGVAPVHDAPPRPLERVMAAWDLQHYLPDDILTKVDRASMAASLEARVPLLDPAVVAFAFSIPHALKVRDGRSKWILRQVLHRHVPPALVERPKQGFGVPIEHWLRGPLRDWAETLLEARRLEDEGLFDVARVRALWQEHQAGTRRWHHYLWDLLMFQAWRETWLERARAPRGRGP